METQDDIENVSAWACVLEEVLRLVPAKLRTPVLELAIHNERTAQAAIEEHGRVRTVDDLLDGFETGRFYQNYQTIMRLNGLVVQVLARVITNSHSPTDAANLLFSEHKFGSGSGCLGDYIDDLPRGAAE
jgi:hypothetical protein